jgi:hypothetical protein
MISFIAEAKKEEAVITRVSAINYVLTAEKHSLIKTLALIRCKLKYWWWVTVRQNIYRLAFQVCHRP